MQRFTEIRVWRRSHELVRDIYRETKGFPSQERFDAQLEYALFLNAAEASLAETEYLLLLSGDLGYLESAAAKRWISEADGIARMLSSLRLRVKRTC